MARRLISQTVLDRLGDYLWLHAGVVARDGEAMLITGPSGAGKSTLVLELLRNGFLYLSDDSCPMHKETGLVYPFPRSARVGNPLAAPATGGNQKNYLGPADLPGLVHDRPCRLKHVICLDVDSQNHVESYDHLELWLRRPDDRALYEDLLRIYPNLSLPRAGLAENCQPDCVWVVPYPKERKESQAVERVLRRHASSLYRVNRAQRLRPDFVGTPHLEPIDVAQAAFYLMGQVQAGIRDGPLRPCWPGSASGLFVQTIQILSGAHCYKLWPGRLDETKDLLLKLPR
jgi:hypothetical protein